MYKFKPYNNIRNILIIVFFCIANLSFGQEIDCRKFRNGKFKIIDDETGNSIIKRKGSKQIEYGERSKLKLAFQVKWLNDCTYTLTLKKIVDNPENIKIPEEMILTVEIVRTKESSYIQKSMSNLYDMTLESEMFKM